MNCWRLTAWPFCSGSTLYEKLHTIHCAHITGSGICRMLQDAIWPQMCRNILKLAMPIGLLLKIEMLVAN
jgi:hypothetical protein